MPQTDEFVVYHITVQGRISADWADYLGGMTITSGQTNDQPITILSGSLCDQAALIGVINNLYNLSFPILTVEHQTVSNKEKTNV